MRIFTRKVLAITSLTLTATLGTAAVASAEGSFNSTISGWLTGISSREWQDNNKDAVSTAVTLGGCSFMGSSGFSTATLQVSKRNGLLPDANKGQKDLACSKSASGSWGRPEAGKYRFTLVKLNGNNGSDFKFQATSVKVAY